MKFRVILEYDPEVAAWSVMCPELPGCASFGDTEEEAMLNIQEAIALYLEPADLSLRENARFDEVLVG